MKGAIGHLVVDSDQVAEPAAIGRQRHHAVGGTHGEQVHHPGLERDERRVEGDQEKQEGEADHADDEERHAALDELALVLERGGDASDPHVDPGAADRGRDDVVAQPVDEVGGRTVLRRALRDHRDQRGIARGVDPGRRRRRRRRGPSGSWSPARPSSSCPTGWAASAAMITGPLVPGPKPSGDQVVRLTGHRARRVVAGVREAEPHTEGRSGQREQHRRRRDRGEPGPLLDAVGPAPGRGLSVAWAFRSQRPAEQRDPQAVDFGPR